ncbi:methyltransferase [Bacillus salitolerans]|uniref:Methyltransferase n=1 Tax=Bacillus salitolerans TaxID=1437434 RepID=A0ABW4LYK6_9BACI
MLLLSILVIITFTSILLIFIFSIINGISSMPTSSIVKDVLLQHLPAHPSNNIAELGAGFGTLAFPIAKKYSPTTVTAYENSWIPYLFMRIKNTISCHQNLRIQRKNIYQVDLSRHDFLVCYLYPKAMTRLQDQFQKQLAPGTIIISHTFALPNWKPYKIITVHDLYQTKIYFYLV